MTPNLDKYA